MSEMLFGEGIHHGRSVELALRVWNFVLPYAFVILMFPFLAAGFVILAVLWMQHRFDFSTHWRDAHQARRHHLHAQRLAVQPSALPLEEEHRFAL